VNPTDDDLLDDNPPPWPEYIDSLRDALKWNNEQRGIQAQELDRRRQREVELLERERVLVTEIKRLRPIEVAARNLDTHQNEGYATLISYLIRLHEALQDDQ